MQKNEAIKTKKQIYIKKSTKLINKINQQN